jgi:hypothetical protein
VQGVRLGGHPFTAYEQSEGAAGTSYNVIVFTSQIRPEQCIVLRKLIAVSNVMQENEEDRQTAQTQLLQVQDELKKVLQTIVLFEDKPSCSPYVCKDGTQINRCAPDGTMINYFAAPCLTHGGEVGE